MADNAPITSAFPQARSNPVEDALFHIGALDTIPPKESIAAVHSFLNAQGFHAPTGNQWTEQTGEAIIAYLAIHHDQIQDPSVAEIARNFANKYTGGGAHSAIIDPDRGIEEGSTRGINPIEEPIVPCVPNDKETGCKEL